jgi:hypothetical protein
MTTTPTESSLAPLPYDALDAFAEGTYAHTDEEHVRLEELHAAVGSYERLAKQLLIANR